jgi:hypothetical protein
MAIQAVLTGDIVNSTRLNAASGKRLLKVLQQLLAPHRNEFYRGDSFQVYLKHAGDALRLALCCRTAAIRLAAVQPGVVSDVRISIGIAATRAPGKALGIAAGPAFLLSGRAFDQLVKKNSRLVINSSLPLASEGLQILAAYTDAIFKDMTGKQAMVIFELLKGASQQEAATLLGKSKSTIHQHVLAGRWPEIDQLLQHYTNIVKQLS